MGIFIDAVDTQPAKGLFFRLRLLDCPISAGKAPFILCGAPLFDLGTDRAGMDLVIFGHQAFFVAAILEKKNSDMKIGSPLQKADQFI
jgi:hypothetical protein